MLLQLDKEKKGAFFCEYDSDSSVDVEDEGERSSSPHRHGVHDQGGARPIQWTCGASTSRPAQLNFESAFL